MKRNIHTKDLCELILFKIIGWQFVFIWCQDSKKGHNRFEEEKEKNYRVFGFIFFLINDAKIVKEKCKIRH